MAGAPDLSDWYALFKDKALPPATAFLGFEPISIDPGTGTAEAWFTLPGVAMNPGGQAQGGFVTAMLDEVMSVAATIVQPPPAMAPTLQMTTSFIRPVPIEERLKGRGVVVRRGRAAIFTEGWLFDDSDTLLAQATASCIPRSLA